MRRSPAASWRAMSRAPRRRRASMPWPRGARRKSGCGRGNTRPDRRSRTTGREDRMRLTQDQLDQFHTEGWLLLPELFTAEEVALLRREAEAIYREHRPEVWREKT